jgi:hypothetical protein
MALMSFKDKIMNMVIAHPRLATLGIGLAITFVVGTEIGIIGHQQMSSISTFPPDHGWAD